MIKELRLATGRGDAKAYGQMEKTSQSENWEESKAGTKVRSLWSDVYLLYLWKKKKIHDVVLIRIRNKYNQAFTSVICSLDTNNKLYCKTSLWRLLYAALLVLGTF